MKSLEGISEQDLDWEPRTTPRTTQNCPSAGADIYTTISNQEN